MVITLKYIVLHSLIQHFILYKLLKLFFVISLPSFFPAFLYGILLFVKVTGIIS